MSPKTFRRSRAGAGPNMTPLVDVVMVILIFLMLAGGFDGAEHFMAARVPIHAKGAGGPALPPGWHPPLMVDVNVSADGKASVFGALTCEADPEKLRVALEDRLTRLRAIGPPGVTMAGDTEVEVILHPQTGTKWERLAPMYDAALRASATRVPFAQAN